MGSEVASKTVRLIPFDAAARRLNHMKVVNVETTNTNPTHHPRYIQATGAPRAGEHPTYMIGSTGASSPNFPTIHVSAYTGPL